jgi:hypothetical protein
MELQFVYHSLACTYHNFWVRIWITIANFGIKDKHTIME